MIIEIIKHTPIWVFILFFALLFIGYFQSKNRALEPIQVYLLPIGMLIFSIYGTISVFGFIFISIFFWLIGISSSILIVIRYIKLNSIIFLNNGINFIKGSWLPLILMMSIFFIKYAIGVALAFKLPIFENQIFINIIAFLYGIISGIFLGRALVILKTKRKSNMEISSAYQNNYESSKA